MASFKPLLAAISENPALLRFPVLASPKLDGELIVGDAAAPDAFARSTSGVMSRAGGPAFTFHVFDDARVAG